MSSAGYHRRVPRAVRSLPVLTAVAAWLGACGSDPEGPGPADAGPPVDATDGADVDAGPPGEVTILRDEYGVPHIFAADRRGAARAIGFTDAEDLGAEVLGLLYAGTGEATRRMGSDCALCPAGDLFAHAYRLPEAVERDYDALPAATREWFEAYAAGVDEAFRASDSPPPVYDPDDPPTGRMVAAGLLFSRASHALEEATRGFDTRGGSNQLVLTGGRTRGETTFVLKDPHNPFQRSQRYHHVWIDGLELFGNFGLGIMGCGSNSSMGFGCTRAGTTPGIRVEAAARYTGEHAAEGACAASPEYEVFDHDAGGFVPLGMRCVDIDGAGTWVYEARFGPVSAVGPDGDGDGHPDTVVMLHLFAVAALSTVDYRVGTMFADGAETYLGLFGSPPPEDAQYRAFGTRDHHVGGVLGATTPVLDPALDWTRPVSSADPRIESWTASRDWSDVSAGRWHDIDGTPPELPYVLDPDGDFFLNCNGNPAFGTDPNGQIGPVPWTLERETGPTIREVRMFELVHDATDLDAEDVIAVSTDVRAPLVPGLVEATRCGIDTLGLDPVAEWGDGGRMVETLLAWRDTDYAVTPDSEAATIAALLEAAAPTLVYPEAGDCLTREQLDTLAGAAFRDVLAPYLRDTYGDDLADPLRVPWGYINYVVVGGREVGLPGMVVGRLTTLWPSYFVAGEGTGRADPEGVRAGSALLQVTSFSEGGLEAWILPPYGQISDEVHPSSPHVGQTIDAYAARQPRAVSLRRADVEAHLCPWGDPTDRRHDPTHEHATRTTLSP